MILQLKKVILLYFLFSFIISYSQRIDLPGEYIRQRVVGKNIPSNLVGSQFYNEAFAIGTIYKNDSKEFSALLRYDAFNDEIQIKQNDDITSLLKVDNISVSLNNKKYKVFNYKIESN